MANKTLLAQLDLFIYANENNTLMVYPNPHANSGTDVTGEPPAINSDGSERDSGESLKGTDGTVSQDLPDETFVTIEKGSEPISSDPSEQGVNMEYQFAVFASAPKPKNDRKYWRVPSEIEFSIPLKEDDRKNANFVALEILSEIRKEGRKATSAEKVALAKYTGWSNIFVTSEDLQKKCKLAEPMKLLTKGCLSTVNEISNKSVIEMIDRHAPNGCRMLLACCDTPGIIALFPKKFTEKANVTFHSTDPYSKLIAEQLTENVDVRDGSVANLSLVDNYYDLSFVLHTPRYAGAHGYYSHLEDGWGKFEEKENKEAVFAGMTHLLNSVKAGGLMYAQLPGAGFMDYTSHYRDTFNPLASRNDFHQNNKICAALRYNEPENWQTNSGYNGVIQRSYKKEASPDGCLDMLFIEKRIEPDYSVSPYRETQSVSIGTSYYDRRSVTRNSWMAEPDRKLDTLDFEEVKTDLMALPPTVFSPSALIVNPTMPTEDNNVPIGSYFIKENKVHQNFLGEIREVVFTGKFAENIAKSLISLKDKALNLLNMRSAGDKEAYELLQKEVEAEYDEYVNNYGTISDGNNIDLFANTGDEALLLALEQYDDVEKKVLKSSIFTEPYVPSIADKAPETPKEAMEIIYRKSGFVNLDEIGGLMGISAEAALASLNGEIFLDPDKRQYVPKSLYLSGNVVEKLYEARKHSSIEPEFLDNVKALELIIPSQVQIEDIHLQPSAPWIPEEELEDFAKFIFGHKPDMQKMFGKWRVRATKWVTDSEANKNSFATADRSGLDIFRASINGGSVRVFKPGPDGVDVADEGGTLLAGEKVRQIEDAFSTWVRGDADRAARFANYYNSKVNCFKAYEPSPELLQLKGLNPGFKPDPHQLKAVARGVNNQSICINHFTGAGKTFVQAAIINERLNLAKNDKITMVVPKATLYQSAGEIKRLFPNMNILVLGRKDMNGDNYVNMITRVKAAHKTLVITTYECFQDLPVAHDDLLKPINVELAQATSEFNAAMSKKDKAPWASQMKKLEKKRDDIVKREMKPSPFTFTQLGIDGVVADEAHMLRNLKSDGPSGVGTDGNDRTQDFFEKSNLIREKCNNFFLGFSTATLLNRSITEIYNYQRYLQPEVLQSAGITTFRHWLGVFAQTTPSVAINLKGELYIKDTHRIMNAPELRSMMDGFVDTVLESDVPNVKRPEYAGGKPKVVVCTQDGGQEAFFESILQRIDKVEQKKVTTKEDNHLKICHDAIRGSIDLRLENPDSPENPDGKVVVASKNIAKIHREYAHVKGTQLIFCDNFALHDECGDEKFNVFKAVKAKLIEEGVPEDEIASVYDFKNQKTLASAYDKFRAGKIRILMGSRSKMGVGMNLQDRVIADHFLDLPWNPSEQIQAEGRGRRRGNLNDYLYSFKYITERSGEAKQASILETKMRSFNDLYRVGRGDRVLEDIDEATNNLTELKAEVLGDQRLIDLTILRSKIDTITHKNKAMAREHHRNVMSVGSIVFDIGMIQKRLQKYETDGARFLDGKASSNPIMIMGGHYEKWEDAGERLFKIAMTLRDDEPVECGTFFGFRMEARKDRISGSQKITLLGEGNYDFQVGSYKSFSGLVKSMYGVVRGIADHDVSKEKAEIVELQRRLEFVNKAIIDFKTFDSQIGGLQTEYNAMFKDIQENPYKKRKKGSALESISLPSTVSLEDKSLKIS